MSVRLPEWEGGYALERQMQALKMWCRGLPGARWVDRLAFLIIVDPSGVV